MQRRRTRGEEGGLLLNSNALLACDFVGSLVEELTQLRGVLNLLSGDPYEWPELSRERS